MVLLSCFSMCFVLFVFLFCCILIYMYIYIFLSGGKLAEVLQAVLQNVSIVHATCPYKNKES